MFVGQKSCNISFEYIYIDLFRMEDNNNFKDSKVMFWEKNEVQVNVILTQDDTCVIIVYDLMMKHFETGEGLLA